MLKEVNEWKEGSATVHSFVVSSHSIFVLNLYNEIGRRVLLTTSNVLKYSNFKSRHNLYYNFRKYSSNKTFLQINSKFLLTLIQFKECNNHNRQKEGLHETSNEWIKSAKARNLIFGSQLQQIILKRYIDANFENRCRILECVLKTLRGSF